MASDPPDELSGLLTELTAVLNDLGRVVRDLRAEADGRDITATVDERGRLTIKGDDRRALGIDGHRAVLDMNAKVLEMDPPRNRSEGD